MRNMVRLNYKLVGIFLSVLIVSACAQLGFKREWGQTMPERELFIAAYQLDKANQKHQSLDNYLFWIRQYFNGSPLQPEGWSDISQKIVRRADPSHAQQLAAELEALGVRISAEWAKSDRVRKIDTGNISAWGIALRTSLDRDDVANLIQLVNADIDALLAGKLVSNDIDDERYYRSEYNEFF